MQGAVRVTDMMGPLLVMLSWPFLYTLIMATSTSTLPPERGVSEVILPVTTGKINMRLLRGWEHLEINMNL